MSATIAPRGASRPRLVPVSRWAKIALAILLAFTMARGALWAVTTPTFWGPDEDYHFLYIEHLTIEHSVPEPGKPLYPMEYPLTVNAMHYDAYCCGPRLDFSGNPKKGIEETSHLAHKDRVATLQGRGVGIVHPPGYHLLGAVVNTALGNASPLTRVTWIRLMTAFISVLAVWMAWVLAAQVFRDRRDEALPLLVGLIVAVQPMISFLAGIVNHDTMLIATFTATLAMLCFVLREPPNRRQGWWTGGAIALALMTKGSALALLPLVGLAFLAQGLLWRSAWRESLRALLYSAVVVLVIAGAWYVHAIIDYGSIAGAAATPFSGTAQPGGSSLGDYFTWAKEWTGLVYHTYWFSYMGGGPASRWLFVLPGIVGGIGMFGLAVAAWQRRSTLIDRLRPAPLQAVLLTLAAFAVYLPIMRVDLIRRSQGLGFYVNGGRYLLPAFAAVAVLLVLGIRVLVRRRVQPVVFTLLAVVAVYFWLQIWLQLHLHRWFNDVPLTEMFHRMTFDRPAFVTDLTVELTWWLMWGLLLAGALVTLAGSQGWRRPSVPRRLQRASRRTADQ